ncbi:MAG: HEPN domain-containing protein [Candidatus Micrarchaeota archaeon]
MSLEECFENRKLRKARPDLLKAAASVQVAKRKVAEAEELAKAGFRSMALIQAYASMFHAGRALLFRDGIIEKSHYCLIIYLKEKYVKTGSIPIESITLMDSFREERNDVLYSLEKITVEGKECEEGVKSARQFIKIVERVLKE